MVKALYALLSILVLASCGSTYSINGSSSVSMLDGQKLYLKVYKDTALKCIDSCDVVHGQFRFNGTIDSVRVANIYVGENAGLPVVLESGEIVVKIDNTQETVEGTPLNEKLSEFREKFTQLQNQSLDLVHRHDQAIMDGEDMNEVVVQLQAEDAAISDNMDKLVTSFIADNFDNVLGPYVFINICMSRYRVPMLDAWVEDIMHRASDKFKKNPLVKEYYDAAQQNQDIMNGMQEPSLPAPPPSIVPPADGPTPNDLAKPQGSATPSAPDNPAGPQ